MTKWSYENWARRHSFASWAARHPSAAAALNRAAKRAEPWLFLAGGLFLAFWSPALWPPAQWFGPWPPASLQVVGLLSICMGSLQLGWRLFVGSVPKGFTRPLGQMIIATLLNGLLASGLASCGLLVAVGLNAAVERRAVAIGAALLVAQGLALPLYAWWRWSGDRNMHKINDLIAKAIQSWASENEAQLRQRAVQHEKVDDGDPGAS